MNRYTLYCTEKQTKKALELGAPIAINAISDEPMCIYTAEQMIGWLEEQNVLIELIRFLGKYVYRLMESHPTGEMNLQIHGKGFSSRKEATLAAIDAALEYLITNRLIK